MTAWCAPLNTQVTKTIKKASSAFHSQHCHSCAAFHRSPKDAFSNLSGKVTFWKKKHFSYFNLYCHQQFYSRMSSFVNLKSNHHFVFFEILGSLHTLLMWIEDCDRALSGTCWHFVWDFYFSPTGLKWSIIKHTLGGWNIQCLFTAGDDEWLLRWSPVSISQVGSLGQQILSHRGMVIQIPKNMQRQWKHLVHE